MESNNCVCLSYFISQIENMLNQVAVTTSNVRNNLNSPANDSGYINNISNTLTPVESYTSEYFTLNNLFYILLFLVLLLISVDTLKKKKGILKRC